jgi:hypothetical protein
MTRAEIVAEIEEINNALSYIRKGGQSYSINTASGGGTSRTVTMSDYDILVKHRNELNAQLKTLDGTRAIRVRAGW